MDAAGLRKILITIIVVVVLGPLALKLWPKPLSFERVKAGFERAGMQVDNYVEPPVPQLESVAQASMLVNGAQVEIYRYDDEGKVARNYEFQKPDPGNVIVEAWNLSEQLGAAPSKNIPSIASRRGKVMMVATSPDKALLQRIRDAFDNA